MPKIRIHDLFGFAFAAGRTRWTGGVGDDDARGSFLRRRT
jgi:hypothetical protein